MDENECQIRLEERMCADVGRLIFAAGLFNMLISHVNAKQFGVNENSWKFEV